MRLICMGTGPFAVPSFESLRASGHEIAMVVTKPQPPVKSRKGPPPSPVRDWATEHGLTIFDPPSINDPDAIERTKAVEADLLVVCDYGHILKPDALAAGRLGGINLHGSLLPKYRGAAPVQRAMLSGDETTGVSVIHMTPRLDGGPILCTRETAILATETAGELEQRLSAIGVDATNQAIEILAKWDGQSPIGEAQDTTLITKAPRLSKAEAQIDWSATAKQIDCFVRGMQPWPVAFTFIDTLPNKPPLRLAVKQVSIEVALQQPPAHQNSSGQNVTDVNSTNTPSAEENPSQENPAPGTILCSSQRLVVATGQAAVQIHRVQPAGKKEMDAIDFVRGHHLKPGMKFNSPVLPAQT